MVCELCGRDVELTEHHLIPKQKAQNIHKINGVERQNKGYICVPCHKQVHALFDNRELKQKYNTITKLKAHPEIQKFIEWVRKKNPCDVKYHGKQLKKR